MNKFAPDTVTIPTGMETTDFKVRMLTINDVVKDYDAVMCSVEHLTGVFGPDWTRNYFLLSKAGCQRNGGSLL